MGSLDLNLRKCGSHRHEQVSNGSFQRRDDFSPQPRMSHRGQWVILCSVGSKSSVPGDSQGFLSGQMGAALGGAPPPPCTCLLEKPPAPPFSGSALTVLGGGQWFPPPRPPPPHLFLSELSGFCPDSYSEAWVCVCVSGCWGNVLKVVRVRAAWIVSTPPRLWTSHFAGTRIFHGDVRSWRDFGFVLKPGFLLQS